MFKVALTGAVVAALALGGCGDDKELVDIAPAPTTQADRAADAAAAQAAEATAERDAAAKRKAKREAAAAKAERAETRDRKRGDALLQTYISAGTRNRWSIMHVGAQGSAVTVRTDLPPGNISAFAGACTQLVDHAAWIRTIAVIGTDGQAHASWVKGDASCKVGPG